MRSPHPAPRLGCEFDAFLFSPIGDDRNGLPLSVVSLLARHDLDPWREAATLAKLPAEAAIQKLTSLICALPGQLVTSPDRGATATRLIALLPPWSDSRPSEKPAETTAADAEVAQRRRAIIAAMIFASYMMLMVGAQLATPRAAPATQANSADAPASSPATPSQALPPQSEK